MVRESDTIPAYGGSQLRITASTIPYMESGADTPEESALARFDPSDGARVAGVEFLSEDQAVVQVGFPGKEAYYFITAHLASDGWYS